MIILDCIYLITSLIPGEIIEENFNVDNESCCTKYKLSGIVVHSGQASGGHYYSYILHRYVSTTFYTTICFCCLLFIYHKYIRFCRHSDGSYKWYKFDDGEVMECKMEDDEV